MTDTDDDDRPSSRAYLTPRSRDLVQQARRKLPVKSRTCDVVESALESYVADLGGDRPTKPSDRDA